MKKLITLFVSALIVSGTMKAQEIVLPDGMSILTADGVRVTAVNNENRAKATKPVVKTSNNKLFFTAETDASGEELWISGLTPETTQMVKDINPGAGSSNPKWLTALGDKVFFVATTDTNGEELWVSDGTEQGTHIVKDIYHGVTGAAPFGLTALGDKLVFFAMDEESEALPIIDPTKPEKWLWVSDGTEAGTVRIANTPTRETNYDGMSGYIVPSGNKAFFPGYDYVNNESLWVTDGTESGTKVLTNINPRISTNPTFQTEAAMIDWITNVNDQWVVFRAETVSEITGTQDIGSEIWMSDGTPEGTKWIGVDFGKGMNAGVPQTAQFAMTKSYGDTLFFRGADGVHGVEPCIFVLSQPVVDGMNPRMFYDINHWNNDPSRHSYSAYFAKFKGGLYMQANGGYFLPNSATPTQELGSGYSLWRAPLATLDTALYQAQIWPGFEIYQGNNRDDCCWFRVINNKMFFQAQDAPNNRELWMLDDPDTPPIKLVDLPENGITCQITDVQNNMYFVSEGVKKLFKYDMGGGSGIINPKSQKDIIIYPNPATDFITISGTEQPAAQMQAFDISGKLVAEIKSSNSLQVSGLASGLYLLKIVWEDNTQSTSKFLVK